MKKHNTVFFYLICFTLLCTVGSGFIGCKSVPTVNFVDSIDFLDSNSNFYIAIPKEADSNLIERIIKNHVPGISDKNIKHIVRRTSKIYCGINKFKNTTFIQAGINGSFPSRYASRFLTRKNGWTENYYNSTYDKRSINHTIYTYNGLDISFPSDTNVCIGRDIEVMLNKFDELSNNLGSSNLNEDLHFFLKGAESEIRFYAKEPKSFLTILTGRNLDLKLNYVQGCFYTDLENPNEYILDISFNFRDKKFLKAGKALLSIVFGLTNSNVNLLDENELEIKGIEIDKEQLYKILIL